MNETARPLAAGVSLTLYRNDVPVGAGETTLEIPARGTLELAADGLLDGFLDLTYAYRFGPPGHDLVVASLTDCATGREIGETFFFPLGLPSTVEPDLGLTADVAFGDGGWTLTVRTRRLAQAVSLDFPGYRPDDNYFHLRPGGERRVRLRATGAAPPPWGSVGALNAETGASVGIRAPA